MRANSSNSKKSIKMFIEYSREIGIEDEIIVINIIKDTVEEYFNKFIYFYNAPKNQDNLIA